MKLILLIGTLLILLSGFVFMNTGKSTSEKASGPTEQTVETREVFQVETNKTESLSEKPEKVESSVSQTLTLDLSGQGLRAVPAYVFEETEIQRLDLSDNELTGALQAEVRYLSALRILNLSNNAFTGIPAEIGQLSNLETLNLSNNQLTGLPYELGNLKNLKVLDLRGNNYTKADLEIIKKNLPATTQIFTD